jgi:hypothetical protein
LDAIRPWGVIGHLAREILAGPQMEDGRMLSHLNQGSLFAGLLFTLGMASPGPAVADELEARQLIGEWRSLGPENMGQLYGVRDFTLTETHWALRFQAYGDAEAKAPLFTLRIEGQYLVGGASATVEGASEATFSYTSRHLTADSDAGVDMFKGMGCELDKGVEADISKVGCGFIPSIIASGVEYDLVKLDGDTLFFGDRSGDLSKARPEKLGETPVVRR